METVMESKNRSNGRINSGGKIENNGESKRETTNTRDAKITRNGNHENETKKGVTRKGKIPNYGIIRNKKLGVNDFG